MYRELSISELLKELGISANLNGYHYLRQAVALTLKDITYMHRITTGLYVDVAKNFGVAPRNVERCIRHAIEQGWLRGNIDMQRRLFGYSIDEGNNPTCGEFIVTIADYIRMTSPVKELVEHGN